MDKQGNTFSIFKGCIACKSLPHNISPNKVCVISLINEVLVSVPLLLMLLLHQEEEEQTQGRA